MINLSSNGNNMIKKTLLVSIDMITLNPDQPRKQFDKNEITKLADSIKNKGIIQPLIVRNNDKSDNYQLIAGQRRLMAAKEAGINEVPVVICNISNDPRERLELAMVENISRENLNSIEEAEAYSRLEKEFGQNILTIAKLLGKDRSTITNSIRLLDLPERIKDDIRYGRMTAGHGRAILSLEEHKDMAEARSQILSQALSVRETENLVKRLNNLNKTKNKKINVNKAYYESLESNFSENLGGLKVSIKYHGLNKKIEIYYNTNDDLNNIITKF
jgi:ParB family chromosome partitioning protein